jgi:thioredoxin 1
MGIRPLACATLVLLAPLAAAQQAPPTQPQVDQRLRQLFPAGADAKKDIAAAVKEAAKDHKNILLVFGAQWCFDCFALDYRFHERDIAPLVENNYHVVDVDIGIRDKNADLAAKYHTSIEGVPSLAVLDSTGRLLYGQSHHEFSAARNVDSREIVAFLEKWKPKPRATAR